MKINDSSFQQPVNDSTSTKFTYSVFKDVKDLFHKAIKKTQPASLKNKGSSVDASCRDLRKFFNNFMPD